MSEIVMFIVHSSFWFVLVLLACSAIYGIFLACQLCTLHSVSLLTHRVYAFGPIHFTLEAPVNFSAVPALACSVSSLH
jgi:hypothetical protein